VLPLDESAHPERRTLPPPNVLLTAVAPGWYHDPWMPGGGRWWDGHAWTSHVHRGPSLDGADAMPTLPVRAALYAILITVVSLVGSRFVLQGLGAFALPVVVYVLLAAVMGYAPMVVFCVWASRHWGSGSMGEDLGLRFRWSDAGWGPLTWMCAVAAQIVAMVVVTATRIPISRNTDRIDELSVERGVIIAFLITAVIAAPFVEELVFRGVILRGLCSVMSPWMAIVVQGVLFGAAHVDPSRGPGNVGLVVVLSAVGMAFGGSAVLLRRIGPSIIAHGVFNGVVMMIVLFVRP
jgi:uncharacterized protein